MTEDEARFALLWWALAWAMWLVWLWLWAKRWAIWKAAQG